MPIWGRDFEYEWDDETHQVSRLGYVATTRGTFFLTTVLAHELVLIDWISRNRARVMFHGLELGELRAMPKRQRPSFIPVESLVTGAITADASTSNQVSPEAVTHVSG
jgi:hypothetical protein